MNRLVKIARTAASEDGIQFRKDAYGSTGIRDFLRDVLALANASVGGPRYIVTGAEIDAKGRKNMFQVDADDFSGKPSYQALANEYIEPPIRLSYKPVTTEGHRLGVFEIADTQDRPYMMRIDYSETLRRGDAYVRTKGKALKMGRRQLLTLFEKKFRESVSSEDIEVGFAGEIIHKDLELQCCDLSKLPSAEANNKLNQLIDVQNNTKESEQANMMARLTHARLFGADDPYVDRTPTGLIREVETLRDKYKDQDDYFLFESNGQKLQMVIYNQCDEALLDASLTLIMPNHNSLYAAEQLPKNKTEKGFADRTPDERATYPSVAMKDNAIQVNCRIGDIPVGEPVEVFESALRLCIGNDLAGKRFGLRYALHAQNLRSSAKGQLKLHFVA